MTNAEYQQYKLKLTEITEPESFRLGDADIIYTKIPTA